MKVYSLHFYSVLKQELRDTGSTSSAVLPKSSLVFSRPPPTTLRYCSLSPVLRGHWEETLQHGHVFTLFLSDESSSWKPPLLQAGRPQLPLQPGWAAQTWRCLSPRSRDPSSQRSEPRSPRSSSSSTPRGCVPSSGRGATVKTSGAKTAECWAAVPKCFTSEKTKVSDACNVPESLWHQFSSKERHVLLSSETVFCCFNTFVQLLKLSSLFILITCSKSLFYCTALHVAFCLYWQWLAR